MSIPPEVTLWFCSSTRFEWRRRRWTESRLWARRVGREEWGERILVSDFVGVLSNDRQDWSCEVKGLTMGRVMLESRGQWRKLDRWIEVKEADRTTEANKEQTVKAPPPRWVQAGGMVKVLSFTQQVKAASPMLVMLGWEVNTSRLKQQQQAKPAIRRTPSPTRHATT